MAKIRFLPPAAKFIKKIKDKKLKALYQAAIDKILEDPMIGEEKNDDLKGIWGVEFFVIPGSFQN
ncbi:type II toxin-antitoxin system RelE/ParE family toxin [Schaedlerella arabinosiphila]|uniref:type II toxin-antitoxin system RelE/ParE family toxin n=1 Tax=Schaedlerella arabinosiphila TaxID=2044587 RepID=UPI002557D602|nr:type II toxin-antitoxin system RelE/ParE family toxin [Schaedlerella arabinosiphila]